MAFKILWVIDAIASIIVFFFFFAGLADGTVSSRNMGLWAMITGALVVILVGSVWLQRHQQITLSFIVLSILIIPVLLYIIYILVGIFGHQRWN